ncbi:MAG: short-chain dehydrogenase [Naasia sp.]|uniref:SDR family NAD(P)-dependent oxidoreductase n=1 Tax=Naasia sp. TaxID=2546198 RepID=UPI00260C3F0C|nr:SDR family oxidoreductase [Naasia sp.]MCU1571295.1 short-chain dehydrogenase [Naasia sp.]
MGRGWALVTGATAGIGAEFARQLALRGYDLVLVARNEERLRSFGEELSGRTGARTEVLAADLSVRADLERVEARLRDPEEPVTYLVNNAGYGLRAPFDESSLADEQALLDVLVTAPMRLSHAALAAMLPRGSGTILNVASVAAYSPRGTYGAAKAWVLSFSRSANIAYRRRGVTVTAVAPGFVHTEFHDRMRVRKDTIPKVLWLDPPSVVRAALRGADRRRAVTIPSLRYKAIVALSRLLPARIVAKGALRAR